jgi:hypothetical protein
MKESRPMFKPIIGGIYDELRSWSGTSVHDLMPILAKIPRKSESGEFDYDERFRFLYPIAEAIDAEKLARWPDYVDEFQLGSWTYRRYYPGEFLHSAKGAVLWLAVDPTGSFIAVRMDDPLMKFEVSRFADYNDFDRVLAREALSYHREFYDEFPLMAQRLGIPVSELMQIMQGDGFRYPKMFLLAMEADEQRLLS